MWLFSGETLAFIVTVLLILGVSLYLYGTWNHGTLAKLGIDGPKPKPFVGSLIEMYSTEKHAGAYDLKMKNKYGKVVGLIAARLVCIYIHDPDMIQEVLVKEFNNFHARRKLLLRSWMKHSMLEKRDFHGWKRMRTIVSQFFSGAKMKLQTTSINKCADNLLKHMTTFAENGQSFEARMMMDAYSLDAICATAFGLEIDAQSSPDNPFIKLLRGILIIDLTSIKIVSSAIVPQFYEFLDWIGVGKYIHMFPPGMLEFFATAIDDMLKKRRASKQSRPDFVQALLEAQEVHSRTGDKGELTNKALTDVEIRAQALNFFLAGHNTVTKTLSFFAYCLALNQDAQDKLAKEVNEVMQGKELISNEDLSKMHYLDMCLNKSLRLYPPLYRTDRQAAKDIVINGVKIPKGALVIIPLWSLAHDPEYWESPEEFIPERFSPEEKALRNPYLYMPFGMGPRNCVGMSLAKKEVKIAMAKLLLKLKFVPNDKTEVPLTFKASVFPTPAKGVHLNVVKRT